MKELRMENEEEELVEAEENITELRDDRELTGIQRSIFEKLMDSSDSEDEDESDDSKETGDKATPVFRGVEVCKVVNSEEDSERELESFDRLRLRFKPRAVPRHDDGECHKDKT